MEKPYSPKVVTDTAAKRPEPPKPAQAKVMPQREPVKVTGFDPKRSVEDPSQRTRYGYRYKNPDGTWTARVNTRPVNYQDSDGSWQPIDSSLVREGNGRWRNKADQNRVDLAGRATGRDLAVLEMGTGKRFGFGVDGATATQAQAQGDTITYRDLRPDSDLLLQVLNGASVKEKIVLRTQNAPAEWEFPLRTDGLTPRLAANGSIELVDSKGEVAGRIPHGFMIDSKVNARSGDPARSESVSYSLEKRDGAWALKVSADKTWLADPARVYPVTIDPTAVWNYADTHDTYVQTGYGTSPYAEEELKAGTYDGGSTKAATYLAFTQVDNELAHSKIYDVNLNLYNWWSYSCKAMPVTVHGVTQSWSQSDIAAYPGPKYGSALTSKSFASGYIAEGASSSACPAKWQSIDLGSAGDSLIQGWVNGTKPNYGLTVRSSTTSSYGWKKFGSRESPNGPYLIITYSPYNAAYAFAANPPVIDPPVLNNQAGNVKVKVTNKGNEAWDTSGYKLTYGVFDQSGRQIYHKAAQTTLPQTVSYGETVTVNAKINPLPPGTWTVKFDMVKTTSDGYALFSDWGVPRTAQVQINVPDVPSKLTEMFPKNNFQVGTLRPQLFAAAESVDAWPSANVTYQFTLCAPPWIDWEWCVNSPWQQTPKWTVPADKLQWGKEYYWTVSVSDSGGSTTNGPWYKLRTGVQQPAITSHLASPASENQEFDQQAGNYTTTVTDANVASAGPPLSVTRTYNSLDPRTSNAFGAGWTTRFDMKAVPDGDGTGSVVVTYPDGQEVRFARNADGTFTPPTGRQATFAEVSGGGWKLMDKESTTYLFDSAGKLTKVTDNRGRAQDLVYGTDGNLAKVTVTGGRSLTFSWSDGHVHSVSTEPVDGTPLTWTYDYTGNTLTKVCPPGSTTECTTYDYDTGSHYRSTVLDDNPTSYWRFDEPSGGTMHSAVAENLGTDNGTAYGATPGQAGALSGTSDTALKLSGTQSRVRMPDRYISREGGYLAIEAWFKTTGQGVILSYQNATYGNYANKYTPALYVGADGKLRGQFWNGSSSNVMTSPAAVNNGQWHHAVLSGEGSQQTLYLDGQAVGSLAGTIDHLNEPYVFVGSGYTSSGWAQTPSTAGWFDFTGDIDEVAIYDKPLGLPAVQDHYKARLASQQLTKISEPSGRVHAVNAYDVGTDRLSQHTDDKGGTWKIGPPVFSGKIDDLRRTITLTDPKNGTLTYVYEPLSGNRLLSETDQLGKTTTYGYDVGGQLGKITDPNGNETNLWFDERGNKRYEQRCADSDTCHAEYWNYYLNADDPFDPRNDQMTQHLDGRTVNPYSSPYTTVWEYDNYGQQTSELWPATDDYNLRGIGYKYTDGTEPADGGGTQPAGLLKWRSKADGSTAATYVYTAAGDLAQITDAAGKVTKYSYDALGRMTGQTEITDSEPAGAATNYGYDDHGRLVRTTGPAVKNEVTGVTHTAETRLTYDADGNALTQSVVDLTGGDPERVTTYTYDDHGQVETVTDPEGGHETYGYDDTGARTSLTDERGAEFTFGYTPRGELATRTIKGWTGNPNDPTSATDVVLDSYAYDPGGRMASHTDAMGRTTTYTYYGDDRPAQMIATGAKVNDSTTPRDVVLESRSYDGAGHLTSLVTGGKQRTDYEYDQTGQLTAQTIDPDGEARRTDYELDPDNNVVRTIQSAAGTERQDVTTYAYGPLDLPVEQTIENGDTDQITKITRDQRGLVTQVVDPRGSAEGATPADYTTTMRYDAVGRLVETTQPPVQVERDGTPATTARPVTRYGYDTAGERTQVTDPEGRTVTTGYDKTGNQTLITLPSYNSPAGDTSTPTTHMKYDAAGQLIESTDPRGHTSHLTYDALGNLVKIEDPQLSTENEPGKHLFEYDLLGEQLSSTGPTGARTESTYDDLGHQVTTTEVERYPAPVAYTIKLAYDDAGNLTSRTRPAGDTTTYTLSGTGDVTALTDDLQHTTTFGYDLAGRLTKVTDPRGASTVAEFDPPGNQISARDLDPDGNTLRTYDYGYDLAGNRTTETTPEGHTTHRTYDALNRLTKLTEPVSATKSVDTTFGYDAAGERTRLTDGRNNSTITTYNVFGLPEETIEPRTAAHYDDASRTWTTSYDAAGNPVTEAEPGAVTITRTFDELNRLTKESGSGGAVTTLDRQFTYDLAGRRARVSAPDGDIIFSYNDRGQILTSISPGDKTTQFTYDANGRVQQRTDPAGSTTLTYNGDDQIVTSSDDIGGGTSTRTYDDAGRLTGITTQYGTSTAHRAYGYDDLNRTLSDKLTSATGTVLASTVYGYNRDDQMTEKTTTGTAGAGKNTYTYDDSGRLASWTDPAGKETAYGWDDAGNRTSAGATTYTYDERNRLTSDGTNTYSYSPRGTLKATNGTTLKWDAFDRLVFDGDVKYAYDGLDRIATRLQSGVTTNFLYADDGNDLTAITDGSGNVDTGYERTPDGDILSVDANGQPYRAFSDQHQDLIALYDQGVTELDGSTAYDPFGQVTTTTGATSPTGYQGEYIEPTNGVVNMHARWYTPDTGTFASRDDWTLDPDPAIQANRYTYANADPLDETDPSGHCPVCVIGGALALAGAAAASMATYSWLQSHPIQVPSFSWSWPWSHSGGGTSTYNPPIPSFPPYVPTAPTTGGGGGTPTYPRTHPGYGSGAPTYPAVPRPKPPSLAQIQKSLALKVLHTYAPRPVSKPGVSQLQVDRIRDGQEARVKVQSGINNAGKPDGDDLPGPVLNSRPDDTPSGTDDGNERNECAPVKDYGQFDANGQHGTAYARFCSQKDLKGGSKADPDIYPPGWPVDLPDGRSGNPKIGNAYKYARCHLIARVLGGNGEDADNLVTCLQKPVNSPVMSGYEQQIAAAVKSHQIVDYWITPLYNRGKLIPNKFHLVARGRRQDGTPGISLDRCIVNRKRSAATGKWGVDFPGGVC
ncbi:DNRLRE domain-containing protein [Actinomadura sp. LD22]|uniref:DNRLRE domain-containing protein n=1 Tax=Actinomadura physcomitrii TaxID=2650748 RepID=A0A6I4MID3_9ACTN|nr:DNRLRE domain-containing protein [Actinomadura physcomitrii]MWA05463.1 DNRLRE domain-containing protein [Actinomadura physcomitrii]